MPDNEVQPGTTSKVIEAIFDHRWAILPGYLETILQVAHREGDLKAALEGKAAYEDRRPALPSSGAQAEDIAVISVIGPIFPRANLFTSISGGTPISRLTSQLKAALEDPAIGGIILSVDSPGGEVTGVSEFAQLLFDARGKKPITAYVQGMAASAAYWIASAADEIILADVGEVGSIGVVAAYSDDREAQKKRGVTTHEIVSSQSPNKRPDVSTKEGRALVQEVVDSIAAVFVSTVARNRGVSEETVMAEFGQGALYVGKKAVDRKMADGIGTFDSVVENFRAKITKNNEDQFLGGLNMTASANTNPAAAKPKGKEDDEDPKGKGKANEDEDEEKDAKGKKGAAASPSAEDIIAADRARIQAIESIKAPGYEGFIAAHKWDAGMTKDKMSAMILEDQEAKRQAKGKAHADDAAALAKSSAAIGNNGDAPVVGEQEVIFQAMLEGANSKRK